MITLNFNISLTYGYDAVVRLCSQELVPKLLTIDKSRERSCINLKDYLSWHNIIFDMSFVRYSIHCIEFRTFVRNVIRLENV